MRNISSLLTPICLLCFVCQQGVSAALPIQQMAVHFADLGKDVAEYTKDYSLLNSSLSINTGFCTKEDQLVKAFEQLAESISESADSYETTQLFATTFIDQINLQRETSHSIAEGCQNIRENIDFLQIPIEYQECLLRGLDSLENNNPSILTMETSDSSLVKRSYTFYWPWHWNWFGWNTNNASKTHHVACALSGNEWKVIAFALFLCAVTLVAIFSPATLSVVLPAIAAGAAAIL